MDKLFKTFATESKPVQKGRLGIIGATPLELSIISPERIVAEYKAKGGRMLYATAWEAPLTM